jgi:hypothetical protein
MLHFNTTTTNKSQSFIVAFRFAPFDNVSNETNDFDGK